MSWFRDRETFHFCVVGTEEDRAEDHTCPHLASSLPVLFHSSNHGVSEHCVVSPWIITFGGCRQYSTENKTVGGAAGAEEQGSSQPQTHHYPGEELLPPRSLCSNLLIPYTTSELCQLCLFPLPDMKENWPLIFDHCFRRSRSD